MVCQRPLQHTLRSTLGRYIPERYAAREYFQVPFSPLFLPKAEEIGQVCVFISH
jgi:hypothetical protein